MLYTFIKAGTAIIVIAYLASCSGIQTRPTCEVEEFGILAVVNNTDEHKQVAVYRMIFDGQSKKYKTHGNPFSRPIEPMTEGRIHIHPGMVLIVIHPVQGQTWMQAYQIATCATITIALKNQVVLKNLPAISSRRSLMFNCPPCAPCPPH